MKLLSYNDNHDHLVCLNEIATILCLKPTIRKNKKIILFVDVNLTLVSKSYSCVIFGVWPLKVKLSYILFLNSNIANDIINTEITHDTYAGIDIPVILMLIS